MKQVEALYIKIYVQQQGRMRDWLSRNSLRKEEASKRLAFRCSFSTANIVSCSRIGFMSNEGLG